MTAVDASAILAIALEEPEARSFLEAIAAGPASIGWPTILECRMVLSSASPELGDRVLLDILSNPMLEPIPFAGSCYSWADRAFMIFGKGRGHPAQLNYGDCMAYAVARERDAPLLFKGGDFAKTDVKVHPASSLA